MIRPTADEVTDKANSVYHLTKLRLNGLFTGRVSDDYLQGIEDALRWAAGSASFPADARSLITSAEDRPSSVADLDQPHRLYIMDTEGAEVTDDQRAVLLDRNLAYVTTETETPGERQLWLIPIYAYQEDLADGSVSEADRWFAQTGGQWMAVAEGADEADWFEDTDPADLPTPRVRAIWDPPPTGTLVYRRGDGTEVTAAQPT